MTANVRDVKKEIEDKLRVHIEKGFSSKVTKLTCYWDSVTWKVKSFDARADDISKADPEAIMETEWSNCLTESQGETWKDSTETSDTFQYSFHEGLQIGAEIEVGEDILIEEAKVKFSAKLDLSATQTKTSSTRKTREVDLSITVPKCTLVKARVLLYRGAFKAPMTLAITAEGRFGYNAELASGTSTGYPADLTIEKMLEYMGMENAFTAKGDLKASVGIKTDVTTDGAAPNCPPDSLCRKQAVPPAKSAEFTLKRLQ